MWSTTYKGYYINGRCDGGSCEVLCSPIGYGYEWRKECKSLHAAKLAITKHIKESRKARLQAVVNILKESLEGESK